MPRSPAFTGSVPFHQALADKYQGFMFPKLHTPTGVAEHAGSAKICASTRLPNPEAGILNEEPVPAFAPSKYQLTSEFPPGGQ